VFASRSGRSGTLGLPARFARVQSARVRRLLHILFILYCAEAGFFLVVVPWTASWERLSAPLASMGSSSWVTEPMVRGAVTGFGLVHLVWGAHDLLGWLERRRSRESESLRT
jgi:hypothetical protein